LFFLLCAVPLTGCGPLAKRCTAAADCGGRACVNGACAAAGTCLAETDSEYCRRNGSSCGTVTQPDNCGSVRLVDCGFCTAPNTCNAGLCGPCLADSDAVLCVRREKDCGKLSLIDNCNALRTVDCGACSGNMLCGAGGTPNVCGGCTPETDVEFCTAAGKDCGSFSGTDRCGNARSATCGPVICSGARTCGGGGTPNVCSCGAESDAQFCVRLGKNCDVVTGVDNCGTNRTVNCGTCAGGARCGADGVANVCSGCVPQTDAAFCAAQGKSCGQFSGNDNCGRPRTAACGQCSGRESCGAGGVLNVCGCMPESDVTFCAGVGATCGAQTELDNCGVQRTRNCGTCLAPSTCGGGTAPKSCGCTPETAMALCTRLAKDCDVLSAYDNCGTNRSVNCGACTGGATCAGAGVPNVCGGAPVGGGGGSGGGTATGGGAATGGGTATGGGGGSGGGAGTGGGSGGGSAGTGGGSGASDAGCGRQVFTNAFQDVYGASAFSFPEWQFRCTGSIPDGGRGCHGNTSSAVPIVELKFQGRVFKLIDSPLQANAGWTVYPADGGGPSLDANGAELLCAALGYSMYSTRVFSNTAEPIGDWAYVQTNPYRYGYSLDGGGLPYYAMPVYSIDCGCLPAP
jgi:hypothetical protein